MIFWGGGNKWGMGYLEPGYGVEKLLTFVRLNYSETCIKRTPY